MVTPLGCGVDVTWKKILEGQSGANKVTNFKVDDLACQIACQIPRDSSVEGAFNPDDWMDVKEQRKVDDFIVYAMAAADQAMFVASCEKGISAVLNASIDAIKSYQK